MEKYRNILKRFDSTTTAIKRGIGQITCPFCTLNEFAFNKKVRSFDKFELTYHFARHANFFSDYIEMIENGFKKPICYLTSKDLDALSENLEYREILKQYIEYIEGETIFLFNK